jgi:hypothetical protein
MKLVKLLDKESEKLVADPTNQVILKELVTAQHPISELSAQINIPTLKLWRRIQKLQKANLVEVTSTQKVGNLEKKFYRSTATWYAPQQYFNFKPKNPNLKEAYEIYTNIQNNMMARLSTFNDVPKDADPVDFSLFANMLVFAEVCSKPEVQEKIVNLKEMLTKFTQEQARQVF